MFQISRRTDYAVRIMIELGLLPPYERMPARRLARKTGVPKAFLHKISADLVKAQLIVTHAGPAGGLALRKPAAEINMLQIVEAVEGPMCLNVCLMEPGVCNREKICPAHGFWDALQQTIVQQLRAQTLAQMVKAAAALRLQAGGANGGGRDRVAQEDFSLKIVG